MVITSLQEKENRKFYVPIRAGNRGGWSLFEWQTVTEMPYRDRQMYLGNSTVIGVLDRGGKWRKRDWYLKTTKKYNSTDVSSDQQQAMKRDMQRMNVALGNGEVEDEEKFTEEEMAELMKRIKNKNNGFEAQNEAVGLGFDKSKVQIRAKPSAAPINANKLQGVNELVQFPKKDEKRQQKKKHRRDNSSHSRSQDHKYRKQEYDRKQVRDNWRQDERSGHKKHKYRQRSREKMYHRERRG